MPVQFIGLDLALVFVKLKRTPPSGGDALTNIVFIPSLAWAPAANTGGAY